MTFKKWKLLQGWGFLETHLLIKICFLQLKSHFCIIHDLRLGERKHLRKHQNASFLSLTPFLCRIQAWFIDLKVILDLLASQNQKVQKGCFREKFRLVAKSLHLCFLLDSNFVLWISVISGVKKHIFFSKICFHCAPNATTYIQQTTKFHKLIKITTYRHPFATSFFAKSVFAKSLAKRADSIGIGNA